MQIYLIMQIFISLLLSIWLLQIYSYSTTQHMFTIYLIHDPIKLVHVFHHFASQIFVQQFYSVNMQIGIRFRSYDADQSIFLKSSLLTWKQCRGFKQLKLQPSDQYAIIPNAPPSFPRTTPIRIKASLTSLCTLRAVPSHSLQT